MELVERGTYLAGLGEHLLDAQVTAARQTPTRRSLIRL
jgi:hypothetical protein